MLEIIVGVFLGFIIGLLLGSRGIEIEFKDD